MEPATMIRAPYLSLVVKGDRFAAARAAADRGIPFAFRQETPGARETVGAVPEDYRAAVVAWFHEQGAAPFPIGTLLLYSTRSR